ncbi:MAG: DUF721 domain-containing protein [Candidatus Magasanikbacteria bacterium]|nr:DUF721 domain-containing protein [Candidatus Magasanikbacteria bacterium]
MSFTPLGQELKNKFNQNTTLQKQIETSSIIEIAEEIMKEFFGKDSVTLTRPLFLKNRTLTVSCASSVMAQELRLRQKELVEEINKKVGKNEIDAIRYLL